MSLHSQHGPFALALLIVSTNLVTAQCPDGLGAPILSPGGFKPTSIAAADLDADGVTDLLLGQENTGLIYTLQGNGDGSFTGPAAFNAGGFAIDSILVDLDGDGDLDAATVNFSSDTVTTLLNDGQGNLLTGGTFNTGVRPRRVRAGDLNGDARPDLVVANQDSNDVTILLNAGNGSFGAPTGVAAGRSPRGLDLTDIDRDGRLDIAVARDGENSVRVLFGAGDGTFTRTLDVPVGGGQFFLVTADIDRDGFSDVVSALAGQDQVAVSRNDRAGGFLPARRFDVGSRPVSVSVADSDQDGAQDILVANQFGARGAQFTILYGDGSGDRFIAQDFDSGLAAVRFATFARINSDGIPDVVSVDSDAPGGTSVRLGLARARSSTVGESCAVGSGNSQQPVFQSTTPRPGSDVFLIIDQAGSSISGAVLVSNPAAPTPFGGCTLHVDPTAALIVDQPVFRSGTALSRVALPSNASLYGTRVNVQAVLFGGSQTVLTNALQWRLGSGC